MEIMLRCDLPDRPGALASLAGAVADAGGDIQAVDVVEQAEGRALDDLVVVAEPDAVSALLGRIEALDDFGLVHAGPSRGHPGDAVTRLAVGLESLLNGAMTLDHAVAVLAGGLLRAGQADLVSAAAAPRETDRRIVLAVDERVVVLSRDYRFTPTERGRAEAIVRACVQAALCRVQDPTGS